MKKGDRFYNVWISIERSKNMMCNVGTTDRIIRVIFGVAIIGLGAYYGFWWAAAIGLIPLTTALLGWCPMYLPFGFNSCVISDTDNKLI